MKLFMNVMLDVMLADIEGKCPVCTAVAVLKDMLVPMVCEVYNGDL